MKLLSALKDYFKPLGVDETFLQENVNWTFLRGFGVSGLSNVIVMTPFIGYLILYNSHLSQYLGGLGGLLEEQPAAQECKQYIAFPLKLNLFYLGTFAMGVSALIFKIAAPREIKLYKDVNEFIEKERPYMTARRVRSMYRTVNYRRPRIGLELVQKTHWFETKVPISKASIEFSQNKNEDAILDLLRSFFQAQDRHSRRLAVMLCLITLIIGGFLIVIPSVSFTIRILCVIFS